MEPVSFGVGIVTLVSIILKLSNAVEKALSHTKNLKSRYKHVTRSLEHANRILRELKEMTEDIEPTDDREIRSKYITMQAFNQLLSDVDTLSDALQNHRTTACRKSQFFREVVRASFEGCQKDDGLQKAWEHFSSNLNCLSILLQIFQLSTTLLIRKKQTISSKEDKERHEAITLTLESVSREQRQTTTTMSDLNIVLNETAIETKSINRNITSMHEGITDIEKNLKKIDNNLCNLKPQHREHLLDTKRFDVPFPRNRWFTGRDSTMRKLSEFLVPQKTSNNDSGAAAGDINLDQGHVLSLHGLPGVGKSHVAIEFAYRHEQDFSHIFWIPAENEEKLEQGYLKIATSIGLVDNAVVMDRVKIIDLTKSWLRHHKEGRRWLIILDHIDDFNILNCYWGDFQHGTVLLTSQNSFDYLSAVVDISSTAERLMPFTSLEGIAFINKRLRRDSLGALDDAKALELVRRSGCLPLLLDWMASFIEGGDLSLPDFFQTYCEDSDHDLQRLGGDSPWYPCSPAKAMEAFLHKLDSYTRMSLETISFFDPDEIPRRLVTSGAAMTEHLKNKVLYQSALSRLIGSSLLMELKERKHRERNINVNRVVRDTALRSSSNLQAAFDNAVHLLRHCFPLHKLSRDHMAEDWVECETFQAHVLALHSNYTNFRERSLLKPSFAYVELVYSCAWYMGERGRLSSGKRLVSSVLDDYEAVIGPPAFLADLYTVQLLYQVESGGYIVNDHRSSCPASRALEIREAAVSAGEMDPFHPNRANAFMNIGVEMTQEDPDRAIEMHQKALDIRLGSTKYTKDQVHGLALNYLNIGRALWLVKRRDEAQDVFQKCILLMKGREDLTSKRFPLTSWAMFSLGIIMLENNNLSAALAMFSKSLELHKETLGNEHMKTLACCYRLAWVCHRLGELERAEKLLSQILELYEQKEPLPEPEIARTKFKLSNVLEDAGRPMNEWRSIRAQSQDLLSKVSKSKQPDLDAESEYDECVVYFLR